MPRYNSYNDYKTAAQRHLMTCDYLVKSLSLPDNLAHKPNTSSYKSHLLRNIYYLSGYTIECMVNYAIYECVNDTKPRAQRISRVNQLYEPTYSLVFKEFGRGSFQYVIAWHNFQENMKVLNNLATSKFSQIPVIGQSVYPANWTTIRQLFDDWEPQVRYTSVAYTEQQIIDFHKLSLDIYTNIRSCITT
jgi:hypothetical protein